MRKQTKYRLQPKAFNGQKRCPEISATAQTAEFWEYNGDVGRRWNVDPRPNPSVSVYAAFMNNPIAMTDILGDTAKLFVIGEKGAAYKQMDGGVYDDGKKTTTRYAVDQKAYDAYKNSDAGKAALKKSEKDFVSGLTKYLDQQEAANKGSNYIARETGIVTASYEGVAKEFQSSIRIKNGKTIERTKVTATKIEKGDFNFWTNFDDEGKASILSFQASCGDAGGLGALPNGEWLLKAKSPYNKTRTEGQFQTQDWDKVKENFGPGWGFTFEIAVNGMTRGSFRLHPRGVSHGCIAIYCNVKTAKELFVQIGDLLKAHGDIKLNFKATNNEKAIKDQPAGYIDE